MSGAPTSGPERPDTLALLGAGWSEAELDWERRQEEAAERGHAGARDEAAALWAEGLQLARRNFPRNDPRLATSLANHALALNRAGKAETARRLLDEALLVWDSGKSWLDALAPERRARSSLFHLRLEAKHPGGYEYFSRERYQTLFEEGRAAIQALSDGCGAPDAPDAPDDSLARWRKDRPEGFTDARKLLAAVLLIAAVDA
jgi:hypothetical protein